MQKLIILNDVSHLSMKLDAEAQGPASVRQKGIDDRRTQEWGLAVDVDLLAGSGTQGDSFDYSDGFSAYSRAETKKFTGTAQIEMLELLEEWEEPELQGRDEEVRKEWNPCIAAKCSPDRTFCPANHRGNYSPISSSMELY